jgi:hypothetical protein
LELIKDKKSAIPDSPLITFISRITGADRVLVLAAIADAQQRRLDPKRIAQASRELAQGDDQIVKGQPKEAIDSYRNAWSQVN